MPEANPSYAVKVVFPGVPQPLLYAAAADVGVGTQVTVELSSRLAEGWVIEQKPLAAALSELAQELELRKAEQPKAHSQLGFFETLKSGSAHRLRPVLHAEPVFSLELFQLFSWMAEYYGCPISEVIENAVPSIQRERAITVASLTVDQRQTLIDNPSLITELEKTANSQARILSHLLESSSPQTAAAFRSIAKSPQRALAALQAKGLISLTQSSLGELELQAGGGAAAISDPAISDPALSATVIQQRTLTHGQERALTHLNAAIESRRFEVNLLFGVTGSGKTEVYIRAIEKVLSQGGSALVIVPEIALTPQLFDLFYSRLFTPLGLLHSQVGSSMRWTHWQAIIEGKLRVVIGARSAVFAPLPNLQLIIVDEEHESSYKQSDGFRYHARDVAVMRAKLSKCPIVLGSATPSYESLLNAVQKKYTLLEMPDRATTKPLPKIEVINLNQFKGKQMASSLISPPLYQALTDNLNSGNQTIILYNRRGFSSYLQCDSCSEVVMCTHCSVPLVYHKRTHRLLCHYCDARQAVPSQCPYCRDQRTTRVEDSEKAENIGALIHRGGGTERVVEELTELVPEARIARMDRDSVTSKDSYREILGNVRSGATQILVGTQMLAKGHDLPGVTLVGIVDADIGLHLPDFRSAEKTFQLITQAAGRAGRGMTEGRVLIQTRQPHHSTIVAVATGRFKAFARYELDRREALNYPPWGKLLRLIISSPKLDVAHDAGRRVRKFLERRLHEAHQDHHEESILGPAPAPIERVRGRFRFHLLVKSKSRKTISLLARELYGFRNELKSLGDVRLAIDVDPIDML